MTAASPEITRPPKTKGPLPRTRGRVAALAFGVPVCLVLIGWTSFSTLANFAEGTEHISYTAPPTTRALTLNVDGQLTIKPTKASQVTLTGTARYTYISAAPTYHTAGGVTTIGYSCPITINGACGLNATAAIPVTVTALTAHSGAGDATVTGMNGPVTLTTGDGNLLVSQTSGPLTLNSDSGNIQLNAIRSTTLSASTGDGDVGANDVNSTTITLNTNSGNITGGKLDGSSGITATTFSAATGDGAITIAFSTPPVDVHVNSDSGAITLLLPPGRTTKYHVTANSNAGPVNVSSTLPQDSSARNVITASTGDGSVLIQQW